MAGGQESQTWLGLTKGGHSKPLLLAKTQF